MPYLCANGQISLRFIIQCASLSDQLALLPRAKRGRRFQWSGTNLADRAPTILDRTLHTDELCSTLRDWSGTIQQMDYPMFQMNSNRIQY